MTPFDSFFTHLLTPFLHPSLPCPCPLLFLSPSIISTLLSLHPSLPVLPVLLFLLLPSSRAVVHIQVDDVNEFSPVFRESLYKASVTEGKIYDSILQVC